eukprot:3010137-Amphidinium_carterae.1
MADLEWNLTPRDVRWGCGGKGWDGGCKGKGCFGGMMGKGAAQQSPRNRHLRILRLVFQYRSAHLHAHSHTSSRAVQPFSAASALASCS